MRGGWTRSKTDGQGAWFMKEHAHLRERVSGCVFEECVSEEYCSEKLL